LAAGVQLAGWGCTSAPARNQSESAQLILSWLARRVVVGAASQVVLYACMCPPRMVMWLSRLVCGGSLDCGQASALLWQVRSTWAARRQG
jgi:hypothetical protein